MEAIAMLSADPLDILFENRNKAYGAYPLRKYYAQRMYISMGFTLSLVAVFTLALLYFKPSGMTIFKTPFEDYHLQAVDITPPVKPIYPPAKPFSARPPASIAYTTPVIVQDRQVPKPMASVEQLQNTAISSVTTTGPVDNGDARPDGNASGTASGSGKDSVETAPKVYEIAEIMPEFPGGIEGLKRYLQRNLRMPETELEPGARVRVMAKFVVDANGKVSEIEITQPAEAVFNTEVRRVISKMPDWKPGMQNHRRVAVYFNLPVNFITAE